MKTIENSAEHFYVIGVFFGNYFTIYSVYYREMSGKRAAGRPKTRYIDHLEKDLKPMNVKS